MSRSSVRRNQMHKSAIRPNVELLEDRSVPNATPLDPGSQTIPMLHSNPGAAHTLWLDFDGLDQTEAQNWGWNEPAEDIAEGIGSFIGYAFGGAFGGFVGGLIGGLLGDAALPEPTTPRFDLDLHENSYTVAETDAMRNIWATVSEDYSPFDIDVTTQRPANFGADDSMLRVSIGGTPSWVPFNNPSGIGLPDSLHLEGNHTVFVFSEQIRQTRLDRGWSLADAIVDMGNTASHEPGHAFGLYHASAPNADNPLTLDYDESQETEYFLGNGGRGPIMGSPYPSARATWWVGEASLHDIPWVDTSGIQDDMSVLTNRLGARFDEHGADFSFTRAMNFSPHVERQFFDPVDRVYEVGGTISRLDDEDTFRLSVDGPGYARINLAKVNPNLDPDLVLYDFNHNQLAVATSAESYQVSLPAAGIYYLKVRGHAATATEISNGYITYGNTGHYQLIARETNGPMVQREWNTRNNVSFVEPMAIHMRFSKPVDPASFRGSQVELKRGTGFTLTVRDTDIHVEPGSDDREFYISVGTIPLRGYSLRLRSGITDRFGNALDNNADGIADEYLVDRGESSRPNLVSGQAVTGAVRITFSEALDGPSFTQAMITSLTDSRGNALTVTGAPRIVNGTGNCTWEIPISGVPVGGFNITLSTTIRDLWGNLINTRTLSFRDSAGPQVSNAYAAGITIIPGVGSLRSQAVVVQFNERIDTRTFTVDDVRITDPSGALVPVSGVGPGPGGDEMGFVVSFMPPPLASGNFTVTIGPDISDTCGNRMNQDNDGNIGLNMRDAGAPATQWQAEAAQDDFDFTVLMQPLAIRRTGWQDFETWMRMIARGQLDFPPIGPQGPEEYMTYFSGVFQRGKYGVMPSARMLATLAVDGKFDAALTKEAAEMDAILRRLT